MALSISLRALRRLGAPLTNSPASSAFQSPPSALPTQPERTYSLRKQKREYFEYPRVPEVISSSYLSLLLSRQPSPSEIRCTRTLTLNTQIIVPLEQRRKINESTNLIVTAARLALEQKPLVEQAATPRITSAETEPTSRPSGKKKAKPATQLH